MSNNATNADCEPLKRWLVAGKNHHYEVLIPRSCNGLSFCDEKGLDSDKVETDHLPFYFDKLRRNKNECMEER